MITKFIIDRNNTLDRAVYSTSAGDDYNNIWIQNLINLSPNNPWLEYSINGVYAQIKTREVAVTKTDMNMVREFAAWEAASDEALMNFEQEL